MVQMHMHIELTIPRQMVFWGENKKKSENGIRNIAHRHTHSHTWYDTDEPI